MKFSRVWLVVSPFVFASIAILFFLNFVVPSQSQFKEFQNQKNNETIQLYVENQKLKENYKKLTYAYKSKLNQMQGRNQELDRLLAEWQNKAVILEINKTDLFTPVKENITLSVFSENNLQ